MIIISQNKKIIVNFDNVTAIEVIDGKNDKEETLFGIGIGTTNGRDFFIGEFKKKENAEKVLQDIISKYCQWNRDANNSVTMTPKVYNIPGEEEAKNENS